MNVTDFLKEIEKLEERVAAKRKELEDEERALAVLRRMIGVSVAKPSEPKSKLDSIRFEELVSVEKTKKRTLVDDVRDVVSQFGEHKFTVGHIEAALKRIGIVVDAKSPRARIGIGLAKLVEEGHVVKVGEGTGNVPHVYKLRTAVEAKTNN